ncbi:40S ribosomal protein S30, partial [Harpegnathos saltator]
SLVRYKEKIKVFTTIHLLCLGKVHGSLARAGKVKAQTPKVEKQEKSKKKTGRAKRRIQYNRRFVNVVQTFGRRRGPNANTTS